MSTIKSLGYAKQLSKYGFPNNLCTYPSQCEKWIEFCQKCDMKWLKGSYGTLVHKNFDRHFTTVKSRSLAEQDLIEELYPRDANHSNIIKSKVTDTIMITSSPNYIDLSLLENYPYDIFIIHSSLLEDYAMNKINLAYCNASLNEIDHINDAIYNTIGLYGAFRQIHMGLR